MADPSPTPTAPPPRPVTDGPLRACPRWENPVNGVAATAGSTISGASITTNTNDQHVVALLDSGGMPTGFSMNVTPTGMQSPFGATFDVALPAGLAAGDYYLTVSAPGSIGGTYSHTIHLTITAGMPNTLTVTIIPAPGSQPGTYPDGTWITLDANVTGGTPTYAYAWKLDGYPVGGPTPWLSIQLSLPPNTNLPVLRSITVDVEDSSSPKLTAMDTVQYTVTPKAAPFGIAGFRATGAMTVGSLVTFLATFRGGNTPYKYRLNPDGMATQPEGTTSSTIETPVGTHTYSAPGVYMAILSADDTGAVTDSNTIAVTIT